MWGRGRKGKRTFPCAQSVATCLLLPWGGRGKKEEEEEEEAEESETLSAEGEGGGGSVLQSAILVPSILFSFSQASATL